nr:transcription factor, MADS-box [Tanacetum cinerariifolium]
MGRWKVPMELINDKKKCKLAFIRRKEGSLKKARELATLCDVNVSMIISSDYQKSPGNFPQDPRILNDMINVYKRNRVNEKIRSYGLLEFCKDGKDNIEGELAKTKKGNLEGKYPTRFGFMDKYSVGELKGLSFRAEIERSSILNLKQKRYAEALAYVEEAKNL